MSLIAFVVLAIFAIRASLENSLAFNTQQLTASSHFGTEKSGRIGEKQAKRLGAPALQLPSFEPFESEQHKKDHELAVAKIFLPINPPGQQENCVTVDGRNFNDGFGSQMQTYTSVATKAYHMNIPPCIPMPQSAEHLDADTRIKIFTVTGFKFQTKEICAKCSIIQAHIFGERDKYYDPPYVKMFQDLYIPVSSSPPKFFKPGKTNVAFHFRVMNKFDNRDQGWDFQRLLRIMNKIRADHSDAHFLLFTQISIRAAEPWRPLLAPDVEVLIDTPVIETFDAMIRAPVLITANSAFSYIAALYNRGEVYYIEKDMQPLADWKIIH